MTWTKIQKTTLATIAKAKILGNTGQYGLKYHNWSHVSSMYKYLHDTKEPYDEALDWAILFHDIVYDDQPKKEYRSAVMFSDMKEKYSGCDLNVLDEGHVAALIMSTETHSVTYPGYSAIIRADLHALTDPVQTIRNFIKIMDESCQLYKTTPSNFAKSSESFMDGLYERVLGNITSDPSHEAFYRDVLGGIRSTINLGKMIQKGNSK